MVILDSMKQLIAPQGKICSIVETKAPVDIGRYTAAVKCHICLGGHVY